VRHKAEGARRRIARWVMGVMEREGNNTPQEHKALQHLTDKRHHIGAQET
jgi:hypothetical protein